MVFTTAYDVLSLNATLLTPLLTLEGIYQVPRNRVRRSTDSLCRDHSAGRASRQKTQGQAFFSAPLAHSR